MHHLHFAVLLRSYLITLATGLEAVAGVAELARTSLYYTEQALSRVVYGPNSAMPAHLSPLRIGGSSGGFSKVGKQR